jgi:hypothetical protein
MRRLVITACGTQLLEALQARPLGVAQEAEALPVHERTPVAVLPEPGSHRGAGMVEDRPGPG